MSGTEDGDLNGVEDLRLFDVDIDVDGIEEGGGC